MAIDFTLTPELEAIRMRVREFIADVVRPGEAQISDPEEIERAEYLHILFGVRDQEENLTLLTTFVDQGKFFPDQHALEERLEFERLLEGTGEGKRKRMRNCRDASEGEQRKVA